MRVHFIGIGGIGMSALARYFKAQKWAVSGSDATASQITEGLKKDGIRAKIGQKKANLDPNTDLVIITQAIKADNPELQAARAWGIRVLTYPEAVGDLTTRYRTIAIAGAHGKSTTTALTSIMLMKAKLDPTIIVGTNLRELGGKNFRQGRGEYLVLEADEFGNAFSHYSPALAIITNIDREHLDVYKTLANVKRAFLNFIKNIVPGGALIVNRDDANLYSLRGAIAKIAKKNGLEVVWYTAKSNEMRAVKRTLKIAGAHNVSNALGVMALGRALGISRGTILAALGSYSGAWRRMELRGKFGGAPVYDDYAHHPTEIRATLQAFKEKYPERKLICVFQPHQARRLEALFKEFTTAFEDADATLILPIYRVTGRDEPRTPHDAEALAKAIQKREKHKLLFYLPDPTRLIPAVRTLGAPLSKSLIIMMGAGDIANMTGVLLRSSPTARRSLQKTRRSR